MADSSWWQTAIEVAGPIVGDLLSNKDRGEAESIVRASLDRWNQIDPAVLKALVVETIPESELASYREDPNELAKLEAVDSQLADIIRSGGATLIDRSIFEGAMQDAARADSRSRSAITSGAAARGNLDSNQALQAQLDASQQSTQARYKAGTDMAANSQLRQRDALASRANLAGSNLSRKNNLAAQKANATDAIRRANAAAQNRAREYNAGLDQKRFENDVSLARGPYQESRDLAGFLGAKADRTNDRAVEGFKGAANALGSGKSGEDSSDTPQSTSQLGKNNWTDGKTYGPEYKPEELNKGYGDFNSNEDEGYA